MLDILVNAAIAIIGGVAIGATVAYFWDDITAWVSRIFDAILDTLDRAIEWAVEGIALLIKEGGKYIKGVFVLVKNKWGEERIERYGEEIPYSDVPDEIKRELQEGMATLINKQSF